MTPPAPNTILHHPHLRMIPVEGGTFIREGQEVTLSSFELAAYPVTQALWEAVMSEGTNPSRFKGARRPVERVSWYNAVAFCNRLNVLASLPLCYFSDEQCSVPYALEGELPNAGPVYYRPAPGAYRLPTEAEWEYAACGGRYATGTEYSGSDRLKDVGWHDENSGNTTQPVGLLLPNELGLYDMSGNVWEWCWDWFGEYEPAPQVDPIGPVAGVQRVLRGGSWYVDGISCRSAVRGWVDPGSRSDYGYGFRVSRHLQ